MIIDKHCQLSVRFSQFMQPHLRPGISTKSNKPPLFVSLCGMKTTFFTMGEAPRSGIKSTVDKKSSRPRRRFSKNAGLNLATSLACSESWECTNNGFRGQSRNHFLMPWKSCTKILPKGKEFRVSFAGLKDPSLLHLVEQTTRELRPTSNVSTVQSQTRNIRTRFKAEVNLRIPTPLEEFCLDCL